ncbi:uncharacterized protein [Lepeophtheirus salmonis]|uniref:uncharacterized protein n=1 Tax=Lepeophtheirus salmonis TaxID=72036 RepID=UPI001AE52B79|nr:uncharacterized protein LOC121128537 isoform X1 [Lepeophtheirus salmonis]
MKDEETYSSVLEMFSKVKILVIVFVISLFVEDVFSRSALPMGNPMVGKTQSGQVKKRCFGRRPRPRPSANLSVKDLMDLIKMIMELAKKKGAEKRNIVSSPTMTRVKVLSESD